jgi:hypothetical protein
LSTRRCKRCIRAQSHFTCIFISKKSHWLKKIMKK